MLSEVPLWREQVVPVMLVAPVLVVVATTRDPVH